jgi:hypothetical protein
MNQAVMKFKLNPRFPLRESAGGMKVCSIRSVRPGFGQGG